MLTLPWLVHTQPAQAAFHLMLVAEVFPGYASNPNAQYVELQMYFPGQNFVAGTLSDPALAGLHPGDFSVATGFPLTLPDGSPEQAVQLGCTPQAESTRSATLTLSTNDPALPAAAYDLVCSGLPTPPSLNFFTVVPCRAVDTRVAGGPIVAGPDRTFKLAGHVTSPPRPGRSRSTSR
jgi:hypothetical protein